MMRLLPALLLALCCLGVAQAQQTFPVNGAHHSNHNFVAFTNATIHVDYQTTIENATLLIRDGKVIGTGTDLPLPEGTIVHNLEGKHIYPSFIDLYSAYGMPEAKKKDGRPTWRSGRPQYESSKKGAFGWNEAIHPETDAAAHFTPDSKTATDLRALGFGAVLTQPQDGIARGTSALVALGNGTSNEQLLQQAAATGYSFQKGTAKQEYPQSQMGAIALLRQTWYDAQWYATTDDKTENNLSLAALNANRELPQLFAVRDYLSAMRADKLGDEFDIQYIIKGNGDEYKRPADIKATGAAFVIPLTFPAAYDVEDPYDALLVTTEQMKHWEMAPANASILAEHDIEFAFTLSGLKDHKDFLANLRKAVDFGLSDTMALKALTHAPATLIGANAMLASLTQGKHASFIITSGDLFDSNTKLHENWVLGKQHIISDYRQPDIRGTYDVNIGGAEFKLKVTGSESKLQGAVTTGNDTIKATVKRENNLVTVAFPRKSGDSNGYVNLAGKINFNSGSWDGNAQLPDGKWVKWGAIRTDRHSDKNKSGGIETVEMGEVWFPNVAYGFDSIPTAEATVIRNTTVWTLDDRGKLENVDVVLRDGKIEAVGTGLAIIMEENGEAIKVINGRGKHVTPGIIDEHSHIAISRGVNEGSQASSAEVSIGDVVNSDDVNIYRQLAGGVTAAQLLHGSSNPIGGQSAIVKWRWGSTPEQMKIADAPGFIKFALGENVKQSNWGDNYNTRYPQTRMGVEQAFYDHFIRAREYKTKWDAYNGLKKKEKAEAVPPRRDLELDVLNEILDSERFITCHSYMQHEINMLMKVADSMGFRLNTFTHILEGYKVADKMQEHGAGGSTFSDWWAYKFEVNDAIPYNSALMTEMGVVVAVNSDDAEMARRLNQEAAKGVKYGGMSEVEALKMVTLNPAKLLHIDHRMGSIEPGKDADVVVWSDNPLSVYAKAEKTFVDGVLYYDIDRDKALRDTLRLERTRLIAKMLDAKKAGAKTQKPMWKKDKHWHCDTVGGNE